MLDRKCGGIIPHLPIKKLKYPWIGPYEVMEVAGDRNVARIKGQGRDSRLIVEAGCNYAGRSHAVNTISASYGGTHVCSRSLVGQLAVGRQHQLEERCLIMASY